MREENTNLCSIDGRCCTCYGFLIPLNAFWHRTPKSLRSFLCRYFTEGSYNCGGEKIFLIFSNKQMLLYVRILGFDMSVDLFLSKPGVLGVSNDESLPFIFYFLSISSWSSDSLVICLSHVRIANHSICRLLNTHQTPETFGLTNSWNGGIVEYYFRSLECAQCFRAFHQEPRKLLTVKCMLVTLELCIYLFHLLLNLLICISLLHISDIHTVLHYCNNRKSLFVSEIWWIWYNYNIHINTTPHDCSPCFCDYPK